MKAAYKQSDPPAKTYLTESKERETNNMKRIGLWAVGIGVLASVGLLTVAQGFADEREHATTCSLATLKGRYLFAASWTQFPPAVKQPTLEARVGYRIFNGDGTGTIIATSSNNGVITMPDVHADLSYAVNADCTGTYTVLNPRHQPQRYSSPPMARSSSPSRTLTAGRTTRFPAGGWGPSKLKWY
jgi:hypothetical protein